jgi:hypothetical protein
VLARAALARKRQGFDKKEKEKKKEFILTSMGKTPPRAGPRRGRPRSSRATTRHFSGASLCAERRSGQHGGVFCVFRVSLAQSCPILAIFHTHSASMKMANFFSSPLAHHTTHRHPSEDAP